MPGTLRPMLYVSIHTLIIYLALLSGVRLIGRRQLGQLTVIDLVIVILLGSAVETAMVAGNTTLPAGLVSAATLLLTNQLLAFVAARWRRLRPFIAGPTLLLVNRGAVVEENLRRAGLTESDLLQAVRARGHADLSDIRFVVMEADGDINVVPGAGPDTLRSRSIQGQTPT